MAINSRVAAPERQASRSHLWTMSALIGVAAIGAIVYARAVNVPFWMEDFLLLDLVNRMSFFEYLQYTFSGEQYHLAFLFRPVSHYIYWKLGVTLFGLNYAGFHVINLLLHAANAALVVLLGSELTRRFHMGILAGAIYAIGRVQFGALYHLPHVQDLLVTFFALLATLSCVKRVSVDNEGPGWLAPTAYALALGAKESAIMIPAVLLLYDSIFVVPTMAQWRARLEYLTRRLWPFAAVSLVYLLLRLPAISYGIGSNDTGYGLSLSLGALGKYGWGMFWSLEALSELARMAKAAFLPEFHPLANKPLAFGISVAVVLVIGSWMATNFKRRWKNTNLARSTQGMVFGLLWFLVMPLSIIFLPAFAADLFITASVGMAIFVGTALGLVVEVVLGDRRNALLYPATALLVVILSLSGWLLVRRVESETAWLQYPYSAEQTYRLITQQRSVLDTTSTVYLVDFPDQVFPWSTGQAAVAVFAEMPLATKKASSMVSIQGELQCRDLVLEYLDDEVVLNRSYQHGCDFSAGP